MLYRVPSGTLQPHAAHEKAVEFETTRWGVAEADQARNEQKLVDELGTKVIALSDARMLGLELPLAVAHDTSCLLLLTDMGSQITRFCW